MKAPVLAKCARCGEEQQCERFDHVRLCAACLRLVVLEWNVHQAEFGELVRS
jgi:hypothetical protein